ncbi:MAG: hypothetical protein PHS24_04475 [Bacilli bacterium]|nr:hypothetical protein [Bacilli bacterium]
MIDTKEDIIFLKDLYAGRLVDNRLYKDGTNYTMNHFIILEKKNKLIGSVSSSPYTLYKDVFSDESYYINNAGKVIFKNENPEVIKLNINVINFLPVKQILITVADLFEKITEIPNFSFDKFQNFKKTYDFIEYCMIEDNFVEVNEEFINNLYDNLETIDALLIEKNEATVINKYTNLFAKKNSSEKRHLELVKDEGRRKLT